MQPLFFGTCCFCDLAEFGEPIFLTGQEVHLVGVSANRRGYIRVARGDSTVEVPHRFMRFEKVSRPVCCVMVFILLF